MSGDLLTLTFTHPAGGGSFGLEQARDLEKALKKKKWGGLLLRGDIRERVFCSGGNLKAYAGLSTKAQGHKMNREIRKILSDISKMSMPKACVVTGDCYGGGVELISCFDFIVTVPHGLFAFWQRRMGLTFGWGGAERLERRMARKDLLALSASMRSFGAHEALRLGLVDEVVATPFAEERAREWLQRTISAKAPLLRHSSQETRLFEKLWLSPEHQKALAKYRSRRL